MSRDEVVALAAHALTVAFKVAALVAVIAIFGPWMLGQIETYTTALWASIPQMVGP